MDKQVRPFGGMRDKNRVYVWHFGNDFTFLSYHRLSC